MSRSSYAEITARLVSAAIVLPILAMAVWVGSTWFLFLVVAFASIGAIELCLMMERRGRRPIKLVAAVWSMSLVVGAYLIAVGLPLKITVFGAAAVIFFTFVLLIAYRYRTQVGLKDLGLTALASISTGGLLAYAPMLRDIEQGRDWVFTVLIVVISVDTFAYVVGRLLGRTSLAPTISPGKTWEGAIGGVLGGLMGVSVAVSLLGLNLVWTTILSLGLLMAVAAQLGDLLESAVKRWAAVKDSGRIIPGHGGVLDRLDSIVLPLVLVYHFTLWLT